MASVATKTDLLTEVKDMSNYGIDKDGDYLYTIDGKPVYINLTKHWHEGYKAGQESIVELLQKYLASDITVQNHIECLLNDEG